MTDTQSSLRFFSLQRTLGKGAMGEVWLALHREQNVKVAIKLVNLSRPDENDSADALFTEIRAQARLAHPNIVSVLDHGKINRAASAETGNRFRDGSPFLVMEFVPGQSLQAVVGRTPWPKARSILIQLLDALAHSHARGIVHRDLKPGNVLLRQAGLSSSSDGALVPKITDFGVAQALQRGMGDQGEIVGTPSYMAPEQLTAEWRDQGPWTDLYSLGCLTWSLLTGEPPYGRGRSFAENLRAHLQQDLPAFTPSSPVPDEVEPWLRRLLQKQPEDRFQRAADALLALERIGTEVASPPSRAPDARAPAPQQHDDEADEPTDEADLPTDEVARPSAEPPVCARERPPFPESWQSAHPPKLPPQLLGVGLALYDLRDPPLIGRTQERQQLWEALRDVASNTLPGAIILSGASGAGKSRLAEWLAERAHESGAAIVLEGHHTPEWSREGGLWPMLSRHLRLNGLSAEERTERLRKLLPPLGFESERNIRSVSKLLAPPDEDGVSAWLPPRDGPDPRVTLARRLVSGLSHGPEGPRPSLVFLDNAQWGRDALALTRDALESGHPSPTLYVLTIDPDATVEDPSLTELVDQISQHPRCSSVQVGPLPTEQHAELVRTLLGMDGDLADRVARRTAGNPFFAVQLVGDWVRRGVLRVGKHGFELVPGARVDLPDDLRHQWNARVDELLDGLEPAELKAVELAAVLGHNVRGEIWSAARKRTGAELTEKLRMRLQQLSVARPLDDGDDWRFEHPMFREEITVRARKSRRLHRLHLACAKAMEDVDRGAAHLAEQRGRHLLMAGEPLAAAHVLLEAASAQIEEHQFEEATRILALRDETLRRLDLPADSPRPAESEVLRCRIMRLSGQDADAAALATKLTRLEDHAGCHEVVARALGELFEMKMADGRYKEAAKLLQQAEPKARSTTDPTLMARIHLKQSRAARLRGKVERAEELLLGAREQFIRRDDQRRADDCLLELAFVTAEQGLTDEARSRATRVMTAFEETGSRLGVAQAQTLLADIARRAEDFDLALQLYAKAERAFTRAGVHTPVEVESGRALLRSAIAGPRRAKAALTALLESTTASGNLGAQAAAHVFYFPALIASEEPDAWEPHLSKARELLVQTGHISLDMAHAAKEAAEAAAAREWTHAARTSASLAAVQFARLGLSELASESQRLLRRD